MAMTALCAIHTAETKDTGARLDTILSTSPELQERAAFKRSAVTSALHAALSARLNDSREAGILADVGIRAYYDRFATWIKSAEYGPLVDIVCDELLAYQSVLGKMDIRFPENNRHTSVNAGNGEYHRDARNAPKLNV
jgi:hypothetical protein